MKLRQLSLTLAVFTIISITTGLARAQSENPDLFSLPFELEINGSPQGEVIARTTPAMDAIWIQGLSLKEKLRGIAAEEIQSTIEALPDGFIPMDEFSERNIDLTLNLERLVVEVQVLEKQKQVERKQGTLSLGYQKPNINFKSHLSEARFSTYTNFSWHSTHTREDFSGINSTDHILNMDHAINVAGWTIEAESVWRNKRTTNEAPWKIQELKLVKDFERSLLRLSAGDISTPITSSQRGFQLFGFSLAREFGIKPYSIYTPTGTADFELSENAEVQIFKNGTQVRILQLEPGTCNIDEYKLIAGQNSLDLRIIGESGSMEQINVTDYANYSLLGKGVKTFGVSFGWKKGSQDDFENKTISDASWYERAIEPKPIFSGYYRHGIRKDLTADISLQGDSQWQRAGANASWASKLGSLFASASYNRVEARPHSGHYELSWDKTIKRFRIRAEVSYSDKAFNLTDKNLSLREDSTALNHNFSISYAFENGLDASLGGYYQTRHDKTTSWTIDGKLGKRLGDVHVSVNARYQKRSQEREIGGYLSVTWSPTPKIRTRTRAGFGNSSSSPGFSTNINYSVRRPKDYLSTSVSFENNDEKQSIFGDISYQTSQYALNVSHNLLYADALDYEPSIQRTSFDVQVALAFADGAFGTTRQIRDSFAIIEQHPMWKDVKLGVNPTLGGYEHTVGPGFFKPVITSLSAYREKASVIQVIGNDRFLEDNDFIFHPSYKRGTKVIIGTDSIYTLRSTLLDSFGDPLSYKAIVLENEKGSTISTFANKAGRFVVSGLSSGTWIIRSNGFSETATVQIEGEDTMIFQKSINMIDAHTQ